MKAFAFVTYETRFSPAGGIAAVMKYLPRKLKEASNLPAIVITPLHYKLEKTKNLLKDTEQCGAFSLDIRKRSADTRLTRIEVKIKRYFDKEDNVEYYFLSASDPDFFSGSPNPYHFVDNQEENSKILKYNALLFGIITARALSLISKHYSAADDVEWILLMQDWEAATAAMALAGEKARHKLFLTLHNSYDSGGISESDLKDFGYNPALCGVQHHHGAPTILMRALNIIEESIFTVSSQFATEIVDDIFQTGIMAPHLQNQLHSRQSTAAHLMPADKPKWRLHGIDNGPFTELVFPERYLAYSHAVFRTEILAWKQDKKREAVKAFKILKSEVENGNTAAAAAGADDPRKTQKLQIWGDIEKFIEKEDSVWFVLAGRDDSRQKGYDVAAVAIEHFLLHGGDAKFLFFPMPGEEGLNGLEFLHSLADKFPANVIVLPFIWKEGYLAALQGAEFGIMPSLYEPFGMANEFYLNGTVGLGRATGGLLQQIIPLKSVACYSKAVQERITKLNMFSALPTGLLYREKDGIPSAHKDWEGINKAAYEIDGKTGGRGNRVSERKKYVVFNVMAVELELCIKDALNIYHNNLRMYCQMLIEGINHIQRTFSWDKNVHEYMRELL